MSTTHNTLIKKGIMLFSLWLLALPPAIAAKPFETLQWQTKNGAHVVFYQAMEVPMLDISIAFAAGSAYDGDKFGLSALTTQLLNQGNGGLDADTIAENLASTGAQYEEDTNQDMVVLNLKTLTSPIALKKATDTYAMIIAHPNFPENAFQREKNQQLMAIAAAQESPDEMANQTFFKALYKQHPYGHPINGNQASVNTLTIEQVRNFYHQYFVSSNAMIVLVGAIDEASARQLAENIVKDLPIGHSATKIPKALPLTEEMNIEVPFPSAQTILRLGQLGITHNDHDYFPLMVGNYILGGGALVSRLAYELREKRGLTYGVSSQFSPMPGIGPFLINFSTKHKQIKAAVDITRETLTSFIQTGPDEKELIAAKQYLTGSFPLSLASNRSIANMLLKIAFYHMPDDYLRTYVDRINAVTIQEIKAAFQQRITPNKLLQITVGKA